MSEDKRLRKVMEERRQQEDLEERIEQGADQTKEGDRIHVSPDRKHFGVIPRQVDAQLDWVRVVQRNLEEAYFVAAYSEGAFKRKMLIALSNIPDIDQDDQFKEDLKKTRIVVERHTGEYKGYHPFVGAIETVHKYLDIDPWALNSAIVNLFRRRGLVITPRLWEEKPSEVFWTREGENAPVERIEDAKVEEAPEEKSGEE